MHFFFKPLPVRSNPCILLVRYPINGTDCSDVLYQIITSACVSSTKSVTIENNAYLAKPETQLAAVTEKLLVEAHGASGCE
ncbi:hypothetical protein [Prolixibacter bellariivorans]|uniref:hypothetical protein n=1 Tax=Prolixibacter bellariivorans TaxID=314319 RepID=UPI000472E143|nr:hypothetical protein [Prolixibacter bellariivorans]